MIARIAKRAVRGNEELKRHVPLTWSDTNIVQSVNNISSQLITSISGGDAFNNREGNQCRLASLYFRGRILGDGAAGIPTHGSVRIVLFWDKQPVIGTPAVSGNIMDMGTAPVFYGQTNWPNRRRFKVIHDKIYHFQPANNNIATLVPQNEVKIYKRFKYPKLSWQDATATNVMGPHLYVNIYSAEADNTFRVSGHWVIKFKEF